MDSSTRRCILGLLLLHFILLFGFLIITDHLNEEIDILKLKVKTLESKAKKSQIEFDSFKQITNDEFLHTWERFGTVRKNFLAIRYGSFIHEEDRYNRKSAAKH